MKKVSKRIIAVMIAVLLLMFSSVSAFAVISPSGDHRNKVTIVATQGGSGTYTLEFGVGEGPNGGTIVRLEPKPNDGYTFSHWEIEGTYTILEDGTLLVIEAFSDITAIPYFVKTGSSSGGSSNVPVDSNTSQTSPQTGDKTLLFFAGAIVLAAACSVIVVKRKIDKIEK